MSTPSDTPADQCSRTCVWAAVARAVGARESDLRVRNPDWLAANLVGREELALLGDDPLAVAFADPSAEASTSKPVLVAARIMITRTRFIDARFEAALRYGITQVVILGAGFDSRAYRFAPMLTEARVFEIDQANMQRRKRRRVAEVIGEPPSNVAYVSVDFRRQELGDALIAAGFCPDQKALFIWEGVIAYLPEEAVRGTLRWIASHAAPGSTVIFDCVYASEIRKHQRLNLDFNHLPEHTKQHVMRLRQITADEPWIFGIPDRAEEEFLRTVGLELRKGMGINSAEAVQSYLTRADGSIFGAFPSSPQSSYLIFEAAVPG